MKNPLISVIIPTYNNSSTIEDAVDSIINQTYKNLEIIIVDDNSSDDTFNKAKELQKKDERIKVVKSPIDSYRFDKKLNRNVNAGYLARNTGFKYAQGEYITFQDGDDASLLNRIEVQYELLKKYNSTHVALDWMKFDKKYLNKEIDVSEYLKKLEIVSPEDIYKISQRSKGLISKISKKINSLIPFHFKRKKLINKLFFGSLENYPGTGNSPLFKKEVVEKVQFRKLKDRIWPSFMGRGADKDFNFQVAETFKNSHVFFIPLYLWRVENQNEKYINI